MKVSQIKGLAFAAALSVLLCTPALADYEAAMNLFKSGKYAEAAAEFQALVDESPGYDYGHYMLGLSFLKMKKYDQAASNIQKALELNGDKFEYHHALATVHRAKRDNLKALRALNDAEGLVTDRTRYAFYSVRGFVNADLDKWSDAVDDLERAVKGKDSAQVRTVLGTAYFKLGYHDKAVPHLREAVRQNPNLANTQMLLGESLVSLARETKTESSKAQYFGEALRVAQKYRSIASGDYRADNLVGKAALGAKDFATAEQAFNAVIRAKPDFCYAHVNLSKCMIAQEKWSEAESVARRAVGCAPRLTAGYESLGYALQKQKRLEESLNTYQQAYDINPSPGIQRLMAVVRENIRIRDENLEMEQQEKQLDQAAKAAEEEYQREVEKRKEWEKRRDE